VNDAGGQPQAGRAEEPAADTAPTPPPAAFADVDAAPTADTIPIGDCADTAAGAGDETGRAGDVAEGDRLRDLGEGTTGRQPSDDVSSRAAEASRPNLANPEALRAAVESVLFIADAPVTVTALAAGLHRPAPEIEAALAALGKELDDRRSGVELREVGEGVRLYTRPDLAGWIEAFLMDGQRARLTQAALETLAVIAYRQPVTRARISAIRGVNVDSVVRTLMTRGLITEVGADLETGGGLYRTTERFLEKMGLRSLDELPSLAPLLPELSGLDIDELSG
jgi:segregation and condensation protein B